VCQTNVVFATTNPLFVFMFAVLFIKSDISA
jgi:hypothetical protein